MANGFCRNGGVLSAGVELPQEPKPVRGGASLLSWAQISTLIQIRVCRKGARVTHFGEFFIFCGVSIWK